MPGDPHSGSKVWKAPDREIGKPGENRGKVIAHRDLQPTAAFHDRENRMSGCVEALPEMQEKRNAWSIALLLQETVPYHQDSGGSQTQPIAHG